MADIDDDEAAKILSGDRWGWPRGEVKAPGPLRPLPPGLPSDPRFETVAAYKRAAERNLLLAVVAMGTAIGSAAVALWLALTLPRPAPPVCQRLATGLRMVGVTLRTARDSTELAARLGPLSVALGPALGACLGDDDEGARLAAELGEASTPGSAAAALARISERIPTLP
jgi:hypothetical protein